LLFYISGGYYLTDKKPLYGALEAVYRFEHAR